MKGSDFWDKTQCSLEADVSEEHNSMLVSGHARLHITPLVCQFRFQTVDCKKINYRSSPPRNNA
jgi:hypothetical protein